MPINTPPSSSTALEITKEEAETKEGERASEMEQQQQQQQLVEMDLSSGMNMKECHLCSTTQTPRWRRGHKGPRVNIYHYDSLYIYHHLHHVCAVFSSSFLANFHLYIMQCKLHLPLLHVPPMRH
ncbi:Zinc finger NHR/GATA-type protein [Dioscorea alata]|uniref:Zinc finger NHR/GATA-type protein n=1 Tax=Dioscorea alata TaxID=55571 RepID=A0ACB7UG35_DIOAL|nr:Zinc finger NHR/GATA-type protein [Dioscorea alata]